jgi:hypothetical protein
MCAYGCARAGAVRARAAPAQAYLSKPEYSTLKKLAQTIILKHTKKFEENEEKITFDGSCQPVCSRHIQRLRQRQGQRR